MVDTVSAMRTLVTPSAMNNIFFSFLISNLRPSLDLHILLMSLKAFITISKHPIATFDVLLNHLVNYLYGSCSVLQVNKLEEVARNLIVHNSISYNSCLSLCNLSKK